MTGDVVSKPGLRVAETAWTVIAARLASAIAVLPIGAAAKEHGHHLPLGTDWLQAEQLISELITRRNVAVWPTLTYGFYPVFVDYPGSISLSRATFVACVRDILSGMEHAGAQRLAIVNTGISTIEPLTAALADTRLKATRLINVYHGPRFSAVKASVETQPWGGHADQIETALMLAVAPEFVDMTRARGSPVLIRRGLFNRGEPTASNYCPSGANGDPSGATREQGERLFQALIEDVLEQLDQIEVSKCAVP